MLARIRFAINKEHYTRDDRGVWRVLADPRLLPRELKDLKLRLDLRHRGSIRHACWAFAATLFLFVALPVLLRWFAGTAPRITELAPLIVIVTIAGALAGWFYRRSGLRRAGDVRGAMLSANRCPGCAYDLAGTQPENDGCVVCPECGAAWRIPTLR